MSEVSATRSASPTMQAGGSRAQEEARADRNQAQEGRAEGAEARRQEERQRVERAGDRELGMAVGGEERDHHHIERHRGERAVAGAEDGALPVHLGLVAAPGLDEEQAALE